MESKLAIVGVFVADPCAVERVNAVLHAYAEYVVGRMGLPYRERGIAVISLIVDAPADVINTLSGKLGALRGVSAKTLQPNLG